MGGLFCLLFLAFMFLASGQAMAGPEELVYGVVTPLSGSAAPWGITQKRAVELACEDVNNAGGFTAGGKGYMWKPIVLDSKYDVKEARTAIERLATQEKMQVHETYWEQPWSSASEDILAANNVLVLGKRLRWRTNSPTPSIRFGSESA